MMRRIFFGEALVLSLSFSVLFVFGNFNFLFTLPFLFRLEGEDETEEAAGERVFFFFFFSPQPLRDLDPFISLPLDLQRGRGCTDFFFFPFTFRSWSAVWHFFFLCFLSYLIKKERIRALPGLFFFFPPLALHSPILSGWSPFSLFLFTAF